MYVTALSCFLTFLFGFIGYSETLKEIFVGFVKVTGKNCEVYSMAKSYFFADIIELMDYALFL